MTMEPDNPRGTAGHNALRAMTDDILAEALRPIEDASLSGAVVVHDFRKAMKRWRALLRLLEPFLGEGGEALHGEARELARSLAGARDTRAALDALADLPEDATLSPRSRATIKTRLEQIGTAAESDSITAATRERLRSALGYAVEATRRWPIDNISFANVADELTKFYQRARAAVPDDWSAASAEELHELRKAVVIHRHQMELAVPLWPKLGKVWVAEAQRLRDRLGHYQDLDVLARLAGPHQSLAPWRARLMPLIAARQRAHVIASARLAGRIFAEKPRAFRRRLMALRRHRADADS